ncbi:MAG: copper chaperone PCu(A)C [Gallionella sp.]
MKPLLWAAFFFAICTGTAMAEGTISIEDPHVRLVPPSAENTAVFMVIHNQGDKEVKLIKAESTAAKTVELHTVIDEGGMKKMRPVPGIAVKPKGETVLKAGDYHVMLIGLNYPLQEGNEVPLTLKFDDGSSQSLNVPVRKIETSMPIK